MPGKTVRIHDRHYQPEHQGSQSAFVSNEFAEEDDYYSAHLGATAEDPQDEGYYQDECDYDYCYVGIAEDTEEPPVNNTGQMIPPFTLPTCQQGSSHRPTWRAFTRCRSARSQAQ